MVQLCGLKSDSLRKDANRQVSSLAPYVGVMSMHLQMGGQCDHLPMASDCCFVE